MNSKSIDKLLLELPRKQVCRKPLDNKSVQCDVCGAFGGRGIGINVAAQLCFPLRGPDDYYYYYYYYYY